MKPRDWGLAVALAAAYFALLAANARVHPAPDPDRWYHFAISRMTAEQGPPARLPEAPDLGWNARFPEKEFLFHALTGAAYRVAGEKGVVALAHAFGAAFVVLLFALGRAFAPRPVAAIVAFTLALATPYFSARLFLVRPHVLALVTFLALVAGVLRGRKALIFGAGLAFSLAYHAFYMPLAFLGLAAWLLPRRQGRGLAAAGAFGLAAGFVTTPYFPASFGIALEHLKIALSPQASAEGMETGAELLRLPLSFYLEAFFPALLATAVALWGARRLPPGNARAQALLLGGAAALFWVAALKSPRACEYAIPLSALALCAAWPALAPRLAKPPTRNAARALLVLLAVFPARYLAGELFASPQLGRLELTRATFQAIGALPERNAKVLNCDWITGSFLLYARPDLRFTYLLDPNLLRFASPDKYEALRRLNTGLAPDAYPLAHDLFGATYTLCWRPVVNAELAGDPRLERIFFDPATDVAVFRAAGPRRELVTTLETSLLPGAGDVNDTQILRRFPAPRGSKPGAIYHDLLAEHGPGTPGVTRCVLARPGRAELAAHAGATQVGLGGGPHERLWVNGKLIYTSEPFFQLPKLVQEKIKLPHPLLPTDRLEAVVCRREANYWGIALSFWKP